MRFPRALQVCALAVLATTVSTSTASAADSGFNRVRNTVGKPTAITAVSGSQVWAAGTAPNGQVLLERLENRRLTTHRLPVQASDDLTIHGSGTRDVWLVSGGQLWHYAGKNWRRVALPSGYTATTVFDVQGKSVYVGAYERRQGQFDDIAAELFRYDGRHWTSLGGPELPDNWDQAGTETITRIKVTDGKVFAETNMRPPASSMWYFAYQVKGTTWSRFARTGAVSPANHYTFPGWIANPRKPHLFLGVYGLATDPMPQRPGCFTAELGKDENSTPCTTSTAVGGAAKLRNDSVVIGGSDWRSNDPGQPEKWKQGTFVLRQASGAERRLTGDPGDATLDVATSPDGRVAWALTRSGDTYTLQRYQR